MLPSYYYSHVHHSIVWVLIEKNVFKGDLEPVERRRNIDCQ